jgi:hypothetical protein
MLKSLKSRKKKEKKQFWKAILRPVLGHFQINAFILGEAMRNEWPGPCEVFRCYCNEPVDIS